MKNALLTAIVCLTSVIACSQNVPDLQNREITFKNDVLLKEIAEYSNYVKKNTLENNLKHYLITINIQKFKQYTICNLWIAANETDLVNFNPANYSLINKDVIITNNNLSNFTSPDTRFVKYLNQTYLGGLLKKETKIVSPQTFPDSIKIYDPHQKKAVTISSKGMTVTYLRPQVTYPKSWTVTFDGQKIISQTEDRFFQVY